MIAPFADGIGPSSVPPWEVVRETYATPRTSLSEVLDACRRDEDDGDARRERLADRISRLVARGRIVARLREGRSRDPVLAFVIASPELVDPERHVVFECDGRWSLWRGTIESVRMILASGSAFNWA